MKYINQFPDWIRDFGQGIARRTAGLHEQIFPRALKKRFIKEWTQVLIIDAKIYTGMYASLARVMQGGAKKPQKVFQEWMARTVYQRENSPIAELCKRTLAPVAESGSAKDCAKWAQLLLRAAYQAGITKDCEGTLLTLDDFSIRAYTEWDGQDIYPEDTVKVVFPAWYQKGQVLEQGQCSLIIEKSDETE